MMWGSFELDGKTWHSNPLLKMSADQQYAENKNNYKDFPWQPMTSSQEHCKKTF